MFTKTEIKIISLLANPMSLYDIAEGANITINTLRDHLKNIYHKLGLKQKGRKSNQYCMRHLIVIYALQQGIIKLNDLNPLSLRIQKKITI